MNWTYEKESAYARVGKFRLVVHRHIDFPKDAWLATCYGVFDKVRLASKDLGEAKCQATAMLQVILEEAIEEILAS